MQISSKPNGELSHFGRVSLCWSCFPSVTKALHQEKLEDVRLPTSQRMKIILKSREMSGGQASDWLGRNRRELHGSDTLSHLHFAAFPDYTWHWSLRDVSQNKGDTNLKWCPRRLFGQTSSRETCGKGNLLTSIVLNTVSEKKNWN